MGAADVRLEVVRAPGAVTVLADGRELPVGGRDPREVALAAARRHAARSGRTLSVELVDGDVTELEVAPDGSVRAVPTTPPGAAPDDPFPTTPSGAAPVDPFPTRPRVASVRPSPRPETPLVGPAAPPWRRPAPEVGAGRPVSALVVAALVAVAVLVGAVGTGVATLASSQALPDSCRPVTLYSVGGSGAGSEVLTGVTDPLAQQFGAKVSVVTVPPPAAGGSYAQAESAAVDALSGAIGDHVEGCPSGAIMLFGYSEGAQVAGDLASRVGTGQEQRIPAGLVQAVGLFGDPARSPRTRAVPEGTAGQGVLPPRAVGFGALDARTIEICAPGDPACDSPAAAAFPSLEQALGSPVHASYAELPIAKGTTAPQWAVGSLGKVVAAVPNEAGPETAPPATSSAPARPTTTAPGGPDARPGAGASTYAEAPETTPTTGAAPTRGEDLTTGAAQPTGAARPTGAAPGRGGDLTTGAAEPTGTGASTRSVAPTTGAAPSGTATRRGGASVTPTEAPGPSGSTAGRRSTTRAPQTTGAEEAPAPSSSGSTSRSAPRSGATTSGRAPTPTTTAPDTTGDDEAGGGGAGTRTDADFSLAGGLEGFKSTPWNNQNATDPTGAESPNVPGREAVKFEMPGGGKRTEAEPDVPEFQEGETKFVGYSGFFGQGFPTDTGTWQLIMQFKQPGTGSPPLAVEVGNGQLRLANNGGNQKDFCPVGPGAFSFQLGITFGGAVDAYCNGKQTLSGYRTPESNVKGSAYLKTGIYRDESIGEDSTLFLNDLKIGDDLAAVSGLAGASAVTSTGTGAGTGGSGRTATGAATAPDSVVDEPAGTTASRRTTATAAPAAAARGGQQICDKFGSAEIAGGEFLVQNNEWGAQDGQCVTATTQGFTVDSGDHAKDDAPAAYPSIMSGCWMGTCTEGTTLPARISELGPISSSIAGSIPEGTTSNLAYDLWADTTPRRDGHNDAVELMIWLKETGGIKPIGQQAGTATIGGAGWDVWKGTNGGVNVISYVRQGYVEAADDLPLTDFVQDAVAQGSVPATAFLTNIQAGFEPWTGGPGMALDRFTVDYGAA